MNEKDVTSQINTNPLIFEELATSLASLISYLRDGDVHRPIEDFRHLFEKALRQPATYSEITELTGQSLSVPDRRSSRGAWLLMNIEKLMIYGVHLQLWHKNGNKYFVPILDQIAKVLNRKSDIQDYDLKSLGGKYSLFDIRLSLVDIVGVKGDAIWLVQTTHERNLIDSAVKNVPKPRLFRGSIFKDVPFEGPPLETLYNAYDLIGRAFPKVPIAAMVLVLHPDQADFELYGIEIDKNRRETIVLTENLIKTNSLDYEDQLKGDHDSLWTLPERLDNPLFRGLPPCRGGRTLLILASACSRQVSMDDLLIWKEKDVREALEQDFNYDLPRDKVRHDLGDRLVGQGFMKKWGSEYSITVKGMARYHYCLAKYTTVGTSDPERVLQACVDQRDRIVKRYGCI